MGVGPVLLRVHVRYACSVQARYGAGKCFTSVGSILISVNPFDATLPLYSAATRAQYLHGAAEEQHLWSVVHGLYRRAQGGAPQCVIVAGESGSGKTFSARKTAEFLADVSTLHAPDGEQEEAKRVAQLQLKAGHVLDAFGNAGTLQNRDSSRFVKFNKLQFDSSGYLSGCQVCLQQALSVGMRYFFALF